MEMSLLMPKEAQATGMRRREPPATPEAPQAPMVATRQRRKAVGMSTSMPRVWAAAKERTEMVTEAPAVFTAAPRGMEMEYMSGSSPRRRQRLRFTGILAALLLVKKA